MTWFARWRATRRVRQLGRIRAHAARYGLDLVDVGDDRLEAACRRIVAKLDPELDDEGPEGITAAIARELGMASPYPGIILTSSA